MICKGCKLEHDPLITCSRAKRMMQPPPEPTVTVNAEQPEPVKIKYKNYHKPGYMREYMRGYRERKAAQKVEKEIPK